MNSEGFIFVKSKNKILKQKFFSSKKVCKELIKQYSEEYEGFEISIIFEKIDEIFCISILDLEKGVFFKFRIDGPICEFQKIEFVEDKTVMFFISNNSVNKCVYNTKDKRVILLDNLEKSKKQYNRKSIKVYTWDK